MDTKTQKASVQKVKAYNTVSSMPIDNKIRNKYYVKELDQEWCIDYTALDRVLVLTIIDLSTRLILDHQITFDAFVKKSALSPDQIEERKENLMYFIDMVKKSRGAKPTIFHSDKSGCFALPDFQDFLKKRGITQSIYSGRPFGNQVSERWNRTFKDRMREKIDAKIQGKAITIQEEDVKSFKTLGAFNDDEIKELVSEVIVEYNNSGHTHLQGISPNTMEEVLLAKAETMGYPANTPVNPDDDVWFSKDPSSPFLSLHPQITPVALPSTSAKISEIKEYKSLAVQESTQSWLDLLATIAGHFNYKLDQITATQRSTVDQIAAAQRSTIEKTVEKIDSSKNEIIEAMQGLVKSQGRQLTEQERQVTEQGRQVTEQGRQLTEQKHQVTELRSELKVAQERLALLVKDTRVTKELAKQREKDHKKRIQDRNRLPVRDAAAYPELRVALELIENSSEYVSPFTQSRDKVALLLLFFTGLPLNELLQINSNHLNFLLNPDKDKGPLVVIAANQKGKAKKRDIHLDPACYELIKTFQSDISILQEKKEGTDFVFTSEHSKVPLDRSSFNKRINKVLREAGRELRKNIKSHSFRINHINSFVQVVGLEDARRIVGHKNVETTAKYSRPFLSTHEFERALKEVYALKMEKT